MPICRSCGARETWVIEYYKHPAPLALRSEDADSNDLLFAQPSIKSGPIIDCRDAAAELVKSGFDETEAIHRHYLSRVLGGLCQAPKLSREVAALSHGGLAICAIVDDVQALASSRKYSP
jgi:hypothetical protein